MLPLAFAYVTLFIAVSTSSVDRQKFVTHDWSQLTVVISPSLWPSVDMRLRLPSGRRVYTPKARRSWCDVFIALLLLMAGVESNPGPAAPGALKLGVLNARSAVNKAPLIHDMIDDRRLDLLVVTETWMKSSQPAAITEDIALDGFRVLHQFRENDTDGDGVALVFAEHLRAVSVPLSSTLSGVDCLVAKVPTRRGRLNLAAVYRPPTSSRYGAPVAQFCCEFGDLLDELLALPGQLIVCGDFNCLGAVGGTVDDRLLDVLVSRNLAQRVDMPTHKDGNTLDVLAHVDGAE